MQENKTRRNGNEPCHHNHDERRNPRIVVLVDNAFHTLGGARQLNTHEHEERAVHDIRDKRPDGQTIETVLGFDGIRSTIGQVERCDHHGYHSGTFHAFKRFDLFREEESNKRHGKHEHTEVHGAAHIRTQLICTPPNGQASESSNQEREEEHSGCIPQGQLMTARKLQGEREKN